MFYTYILRNNKTSRYYVGYTVDLKNRIKEHQEGKVLSTKSDPHYELEWYCAFKTEKQAVIFEKYLKSGSGIAFMKKRFFKSSAVALAKDNSNG
ncbi:MAG: GIY-YIG nuclease family protein [Patescibacteria group bacterium]